MVLATAAFWRCERVLVPLARRRASAGSSCGFAFVVIRSSSPGCCDVPSITVDLLARERQSRAHRSLSAGGGPPPGAPPRLRAVGGRGAPRRGPPGDRARRG